jgi:hypothetical protein
MALPTGAIPAAPPNLGSDESGKQEYFEALNKTLKALEDRSGNAINLWNVAGQFLNPGRTGSFGEALGNVATSVGRDTEKQLDMALPIAQMRANIAGQKYQVENETKALNMFANAVGLTPSQAAGALESGNVTPDMLSRIPSNLYVAINKLDPKLGDSIKNGFNMDVERRKLVNDDIKNGLSVADMIAKYGEGIKSYLPANMPSSSKPAEPKTTEPKAGETKPEEEPLKKLLAPKDLATQIENDFGIKLGPAALTRTREQQKDLIDRAARGEKNIFKPSALVDGKDVYHENAVDVPTSVPESYLRARGYYRPDKNDPVHAIPIPGFGGEKKETSTTVSKPVDLKNVTVGSDISELPLAAQAEVKKTRANSQDKMYEVHRSEIVAYNPQTTESTANRLRELHDIAGTRPNIFGLMQQQGLMSAIKNSAAEGIQAGRLGSVSLPVQTFIEKTNLSKDDQKVLRRASQLMAEQFFENAKAEKSVLGPQISNADAQFMQRPMVTEKDAASTVQYWAKNHLLLNAQRGELFKSLQQHDQRVGANAPFGSYFGSDPYINIVKKYSDLNKQLRQRYPDFGAK